MNTNSFIDLVINLLKDKMAKGYDVKDVIEDLKKMKIKR